MTFDYVIIGGGMSGIICAGWLGLHKPGATVAIIEPGELGASYTQGGLRYLRHTPAMVALLEGLRVKSAPVQLGGGALLPTGAIVAYPDGLGDQLEAVQRQHYLKTRGTMDGYTAGAMNFGGTNQLGLDADNNVLIRRCVGNARVIEGKATRASGRYVWVGTAIIEARAALISTIPLPLYAKLLGLTPTEAPKCQHRTLCVQRVEVTEAMPAFLEWSYTYTPWLRRIHRVAPTSEAVVELEWNEGHSGETRRDMVDIGIDPIDANPDDAKRIPGHLLPIEWGTWRPPEGVLLIGRFASWEARATVDSALPTLEQHLG